MIKYLLLLTLIFIGGCKNKTPLKEIYLEKVIYNPEKEKDILESGLIKDITLIPLETTPECLLDAFSLVIKDTTYYLVDYFNNKGVFRFNAEGKFLNRIGNVGNGPEEYTDLSDFSFDNAGNILLYSSMEESVYYYSIDGTFRNKFQLNCYFHKATNDKEGNYWLYRGQSNERGHSLLTKINNEGEILFEGMNEEYNILSFPEIFPVFSKNDTVILMRQSLSPIIYQLRDTLITSIYEFDFGRYAIPYEFYTKNSLVEAGELLFAREYIVINKFIENKEYILVETILHKTITSQFTISYGIKNKNKDEWRWFEMNDNISYGLTFHQFSENNELMGLVDAWKLKEWKNRDIFVNPEVIDQLKEDDNPVIMLCRLAW